MSFASAEKVCCSFFAHISHLRCVARFDRQAGTRSRQLLGKAGKNGGACSWKDSANVRKLNVVCTDLATARHRCPLRCPETQLSSSAGRAALFKAL